jgi:hypothetical protein
MGARLADVPQQLLQPLTSLATRVATEVMFPMIL